MIVTVRVHKVVFAVSGAVILIAALAVVGLLYYIGHQMKLRIVPDGGSALMAVDTDGLRQLNALYALPKVCGDTVLRARGSGNLD